VWLASAYLVGIGLRAAPFETPSPLLFVLCLVAPLIAWRRPGANSAAFVAALAGLVAGAAADLHRKRDCSRVLTESDTVVRGAFVARPIADRRSVRFEVSTGPSGCDGALLVVPPAGSPPPAPGPPVSVTGRWLASDGGNGAGGVLIASAVKPAPGGLTLSGRLHLYRDGAARRLETLFPRRWALVHALVLARKDGLDPELRDAFAATGLAHLLAISGFHVGVVAALLLALFSLTGLSRSRAAVAAATGVWVYVLGIGAPDAAVRAAVLLTVGAVARLRARPVHALGALAAALVAMAVIDPGASGRVGFQLSFAGAAGLVSLSGPIERCLARGHLRRAPASLRSAGAAGAAATMATLPLVAWHFERVSVVGIPATLLVGPLVAASIPGIFASVTASAVSPALGSFVAGGVEWVLDAVVWFVTAMARWPLASIPVSRWAVLAACAGFALAPRFLPGPVLTGRRVRRRIALAGSLAGLIVWPGLVALAGSGTVEAVFLDVGQGDAILLRSPRGRWILVDAGPRTEGRDAGARVVLPYLRRRGVGRLHALVLTHPDLDHVGGAPSVLDALGAEVVFDPGVPVGKASYVDVLEGAGREGSTWLPLHRGRRLGFDGAELEVLHPPVPGPGVPPLDANDRSVVIRVTYGAFSLLLTGDVESAGEAMLLDSGDLRPTQVLKVAHHGSRTSTSPGFLEVARPEVAVIPVGRRNRYGHPDPGVLARLDSAGATIHRTDLEGTVRIVARPDGSYRVRASRPGGRFH
jgi:competence protein ComEC